MKTTTPKFKLSKTSTIINCRVQQPSHRENVNGEDVFVLSHYESIPCEGWKMEQTFFPGHDFYVCRSARYPDLFHLIEYSTGTPISGAFPDKTKNKAAEWMRTRLDGCPSYMIVQLIQTTLIDHGRYNGFEKAFSVDGLTVGLDNMVSETNDPVELFDLDIIPVGSTYYFQNGKTVKRIL